MTSSAPAHLRLLLRRRRWRGRAAAVWRPVPVARRAAERQQPRSGQQQAEARQSQQFAPHHSPPHGVGFVPPASNGAEPTPVAHKPGECRRFVAQIARGLSSRQSCRGTADSLAESSAAGGCASRPSLRGARAPAAASRGSRRSRRSRGSPPGRPAAARAARASTIASTLGQEDGVRRPAASDRRHEVGLREPLRLRHLARQVRGRDVHAVGRAKARAKSSWKTRVRGGVGARLEDRHEPPAPAERAAAPRASRARRSGGARSRRRRSTPRASPRSSRRRLTPRNAASASRTLSGCDPGLGRHRQRGERVPDVVLARQRQRELALVPALANEPEARAAAAGRARPRPASRPSASSPKVSTRQRACGRISTSAGLSVPATSSPLRGITCSSRTKAVCTAARSG